MFENSYFSIQTCLKTAICFKERNLSKIGKTQTKNRTVAFHPPPLRERNMQVWGMPVFDQVKILVHVRNGEINTTFFRTAFYANKIGGKCSKFTYVRFEQIVEKRVPFSIGVNQPRKQRIAISFSVTNNVACERQCKNHKNSSLKILGLNQSGQGEEFPPSNN